MGILMGSKMETAAPVVQIGEAMQTSTADFVENATHSTIMSESLVRKGQLKMSRRPLRVLVIEDEQDIREVLVDCLTGEGFVVESLASPLDALPIIDRFKPDILTVDRKMPHISGERLIQMIRGVDAYAKIPIIVVSGLGSEADKVLTLDIGADDYMTKPFYPSELVARINALMRRVGPDAEPTENKVIEFDGIRIDLGAHEVFIGNENIRMTLTEFKILKELLTAPNRVFTRDELKLKVLNSMNVTDRTIDVHIAALRRKMGDKSNSIHSVRGVGYKYIG